MRRLLLAAAVLLAAAAPASAHVTVNPREATQGGFTKVAFRVPNERDNASTTSLRVVFPTESPIAGVSVRPHPAWRYEVKRTKLATPIQREGGAVTDVVSEITWTGGRIEPGQFDEFEVSLGPLPSDADRLVFRASQTYSNGEVVNWVELPAAGAADPEHPAPILQLNPAASASPSASPTAAGTTGSPASVPTEVRTVAPGEDDGDDTMAVAGLGAGLAGLLAGLAALFVALRNRGGSHAAG